ncbi:MAG TPA: diaminopimelate epimerase [Planctomycetota bacterium]|nr:diaminopimelate epimerase [Planctomycetota bacterium]
MMRLRFVKMEGAGNDYVYVDAIRQRIDLDVAQRLAPRLADRHYGIGGDGLILLAPSASADVRMVMWNADGSRGAMCGNGVRCLAKLAYDEGIARRPSIVVETDGGVRAVDLLFDGATVVGARVDMGAVRVETEPRTLLLTGRTVTFHAGDAGNPHAVVFVDDVDAAPVEEVGRGLQRAATFPDGVNVEFVEVRPDGSLRQRTFERGSGETLACGSGATVAAAAAVRTGRVAGPKVDVLLRGGTLTIDVGDDRVLMSGPAREVFRGEVEVDPTA